MQICNFFFRYRIVLIIFLSGRAITELSRYMPFFCVALSARSIAAYTAATSPVSMR